MTWDVPGGANFERLPLSGGQSSDSKPRRQTRTLQRSSCGNESGLRSQGERARKNQWDGHRGQSPGERCRFRESHTQTCLTRTVTVGEVHAKGWSQLCVNFKQHIHSLSVSAGQEPRHCFAGPSVRLQSGGSQGLVLVQRLDW